VIAFSGLQFELARAHVVSDAGKIQMNMLRWAAALRAKDRTFRGLIDSTSTALQT
jgi:hypothetical protein